MFTIADNNKAPAYYHDELRKDVRIIGDIGRCQFLFRFFKPDHLTCMLSAVVGGERVIRTVECTTEEAGIPIKELVPQLWKRAPE